ncbi:hypothetical protein [Pseudomonas gessardii]|uniref:Uncharacterized protein n=1 Tax=Pseudomonas gessardii TaxID=78544 RepID=A0A7Y1QNU4_9PSED|nr:hypothetical protein [Pseudomonas gessardii]NNA97952.1 hypothetical protein [Pseudomonas gessardii]
MKHDALSTPKPTDNPIDIDYSNGNGNLVQAQQAIARGEHDAKLMASCLQTHPFHFKMTLPLNHSQDSHGGAIW